jgi:hypothetical protein
VGECIFFWSPCQVKQGHENRTRNQRELSSRGHGAACAKVRNRNICTSGPLRDKKVGNETRTFSHSFIISYLHFVCGLRDAATLRRRPISDISLFRPQSPQQQQQLHGDRRPLKTSRACCIATTVTVESNKQPKGGPEKSALPGNGPWIVISSSGCNNVIVSCRLDWQYVSKVNGHEGSTATHSIKS